MRAFQPFWRQTSRISVESVAMTTSDSSGEDRTA